MPDLIDDATTTACSTTCAATAPRSRRWPTGTARRPDYPVGSARIVPATARPMPTRPSGRRRHGLLVAAAAVVLVVVVAAVAVVRRADGAGPVVDTPPTTVPVPTAPPFEDGTVLMWLPYEEPPQYLGAGRRPAGVARDRDPPQPGRCARSPR